MQYLDFFANIAVALLLGAGIGFERQWRQRLAGLRTNALVALGAGAFVALSALISVGNAAADPTRIAAQVVSGIGFLGGGLILKEGLNVRGLNTAATLWCSAAVGALAGAGDLIPATLAALLVLAANILLRPMGALINRQPIELALELEACYQIEITCRTRVENHIRNSLLQESASDGLLLKSLRRENLDDPSRVRLIAEIVTQGRNDRLIERIASRLSLEQGTSAITWRAHQHQQVVEAL
jgi:putative Mg2+ transporter-C (MgtC) family protein